MKSIAGIGGTSQLRFQQLATATIDESLGGPFVEDSTIVYEIKTPIHVNIGVSKRKIIIHQKVVHTGDDSLEQRTSIIRCLPLLYCTR